MHTLWVIVAEGRAYVTQSTMTKDITLFFFSPSRICIIPGSTTVVISNEIQEEEKWNERNTMRNYSIIFCLLNLVLANSFLIPSTRTRRHSTTTSSSYDNHKRPNAIINSSTQLQTKSPTSENSKTVASTTAFDIEFPPPLGPVDRIARAATFWAAVLPIVASYYGLISRIKLEQLLRGTTKTDEQLQPLWDVLHERGATKMAHTVSNLQGFYVKTAQIVSQRQDLFPQQYTDALSDFTDNVDPMPAALVKAIIQKELLRRDEAFEDVFCEFDEAPLGAASVAQVHRARLTPAFGNREVAVKVQRPSIESKLMGDISNLKAITKTFRDSPSLPLDYYTVFCELEKQLQEEFDFVAEAVAMDRIYNSLSRAPDGSVRELPLVVPRPVSGLVSRRVLVMDYLHGVPLSRAREEMQRRGISPDSPEAKLFGRNLLAALTSVFGRTILETGFFHADPHAGNIFVLENGQIGLIDFGQVKQISGRTRETLCKVMIALDERRDDHPEDADLVGKLALELGVELKETAKPDAAAAVGIWLFDGTVDEIPGGYDKGELDANSPVKELKSFPQDLVLVGRATILIKALSNRLNVPWSLAKEWAPIAREVIASNYKSVEATNEDSRVRFKQVWRLFRSWSKGRMNFVVRHLPQPVRTRVANVILKVQESRIRRKLAKRSKRH
ncbi:hypothetical protein MPSEU_000356000 [Mayamaea pseudoterrestris]|nr:hypothetical protein MPSEU_000356000 [Mayamaea pseudoterrestris]